MASPIRILCVDDNELMAEALRRRLNREPDLEWSGWLPSAADLASQAAEHGASIVVLDVDIPGDDTFEAVRDLSRESPGVRVLMLSGHASRDYVDMAVDAGAWGYMLKSEETDAIIDAIRRVARGEFVASTESLEGRRV